MLSLRRQLFGKFRHILLYGVVMGVIVFTLKWLQWKYLIADHSSDIYIGLIAVIFTFLGVWIVNQLAKPKVQTVVVEKEVFVSRGKERVRRSWQSNAL